MTARNMVAVASLAMAGLGGALTLVAAGHPPVLDVEVQWWMLAVAFLVAERFVSHVEIRNQAHTISLSEAVLLIAVLTLSPYLVVGARVVGAVPAILLRRTSPEKAAFNLALFVLEAGLATAVFHVVLGSPSAGAAAWGFAAVAVLVSVLTTAAIVSTLISKLDPDRPPNLLLRVIAVQAATASLALSLTVVGAAAVSASVTNALYLAIVFAGAVLMLRSQTKTAQRASNLQSVGRFSAQLIGLASTEDVLEVAVKEAATVMRTSHAAIVSAANDEREPVVFGVDGAHIDLHRLRTLTSHAIGAPCLLSAVDGHGDDDPRGFAAPLRIGEESVVFLAWGASTTVSDFNARNLNLFGSMVDQTQVALSRSVLIDQLDYDAHHDALTGLPNRRGFAHNTGEQLTGGALLMMDLDRFKDINDTLGHPTGDRALELVAKRLLTIKAPGVTLARFGGDEFALFDPQCDTSKQATALAEDVIKTIEHPIVLNDLTLRLGVSIGVALAPIDGDNTTALVSHADQALHEAKRQHLGWQFYNRQRDTNDPRRLELLSSLRQAVAAHELDVWYQPKIRIADRTVIGAEALARWEHPRYGFVPPDEFIALAEGAGLMRELTDAVLQRVVNDLQTWGDNAPINIAVNLSTRNLLDEQLPDRIDAMIQLAGISRNQIAFEVTETSMMLDRERVAVLLRKLHHDLGFDIAIDDYGTGYSSLAYLRELPVNQLKIDRAFVANLDLDPANEVIIRSTIDLGHNLGMTIVAEGVEREPELQLLEQLGCEYAQGYLISRPLPAKQFLTWLNNTNDCAPRPAPPTNSAISNGSPSEQPLDNTRT